MRTDRILFIDTETGGLDPTKHSLLSIALVVWQECSIIDQIEVLINDGILNVTKHAIEINKIDIEEHRKNALHPSNAISEIDCFLNKHFEKNEKITLAGHNINFDVNFLKHFLIERNYNFHSRFSHRYLDTASILYFLYLTDKIKTKVISSDEAFKYFNITINKRHTALGDALATTKLFNELIYTNQINDLSIFK